MGFLLQFGLWKEMHALEFESFLGNKVTAVTFMQNDSLAVVGSIDRSIKVWDIEKGMHTCYHSLSITIIYRKCIVIPYHLISAAAYYLCFRLIFWYFHPNFLGFSLYSTTLFQFAKCLNSRRSYVMYALLRSKCNDL